MKSEFSRRLIILHEEVKYGQKMNQEDILTDIEAETGHKIAQSSYSSYLNDTKVPSHLTVRALCKYFNVSYEWLVGDVDDRRPAEELIKDLKNIGDEETQKAAKALATLPTTERTAIIANIHAAVKEHENQIRNDQRWEMLAEMIRIMDNNGSLKAFVGDELSSIENGSSVSSDESVPELVN